jgi:hypothetical protein
MSIINSSFRLAVEIGAGGGTLWKPNLKMNDWWKFSGDYLHGSLLSTCNGTGTSDRNKPSFFSTPLPDM